MKLYFNFTVIPIYVDLNSYLFTDLLIYRFININSRKISSDKNEFVFSILKFNFYKVKKFEFSVESGGHLARGTKSRLLGGLETIDRIIGSKGRNKCL